MDLMWIIYFIDTLAGATIPAVFVGALYLAAVFVYMVYYGIERDENKVGSAAHTAAYAAHARMFTLNKAHLAVMTFLIAGSVLNIIIPDKDTAYKMLAAYGVTEIASNDKVQQLGGKSLEVLEKVMDSYLKESEEQ